ncbi:MAG TPA: hypothetical protein VGF18_07740 [Candidatus Tumulicola sp.]|jgi:Cu/Zn superoxide dismutase
MKSSLRAAIAALSVAALASIAPAIAADNMSSGMMAASSMTVKLNAQNGSGESGTASIKDVTGGVSVVIELKGGPATAQPAHIHTGSCSSDVGVKYALTNVVKGTSTTMVKGTSIAKLLASPTSINVHESATNMQKYVACGNIAK